MDQNIYRVILYRWMKSKVTQTPNILQPDGSPDRMMKGGTRPKLAIRLIQSRGCHFIVGVHMTSVDEQLAQAVAGENLQGTMEALSNGGDPNTCFEGSIPVLCMAARFGLVEIVQVLLQAGADPNVSYNEILPLMIAKSELEFATTSGFTDAEELSERLKATIAVLSEARQPSKTEPKENELPRVSQPVNSETKVQGDTPTKHDVLQARNLADRTHLIWASASGDDAIGSWAEITVEGVIQRLRWIPPGDFMMGSPDNQEGHRAKEGPLHEVTFHDGFWLFDTPCTQALWVAVMNENPSEFKSPTRPVEMVSWLDAHSFIERINERIDGLGLALPSEAQWEYACRAGEGATTYAGHLHIVGENNAPVLDAIAWYSGNSGVNFDLEQGRDSSYWPEKQYAHMYAGTRAVGTKRANAWGFYDMLGNVFEWVEDTWHDRYESAPANGTSWMDGGKYRQYVMRGGGWTHGPDRMRAAHREWSTIEERFAYLGFRLSRS